MPPSMLAQLAIELERQLPLVKVLADVEAKAPVAQAELTRILAAQKQAEKEAAEARRSADVTITLIQAELMEKTEKFKADLVVRHAVVMEDFDTLQRQSKAARIREHEQLRLHKDTLADLRRDIEQAQRELDGYASRLVTAKAEFARALAGAVG